MLVIDMDPEGAGRATGYTVFRDAIQYREINPTGFKEHYNSLAVRAALDAFNSGARLCLTAPLPARLSDPPSLLGA